MSNTLRCTITCMSLAASASALAAQTPLLPLPVHFLTAGARELCAADFNGDQHLDFAVATSANSPTSANYALSVYLGDGAGAFPTHTDLGQSQAAFGVAAGDMDGDGDTDVAAVRLSSILTFLNDGTGTNFALITTPISPTASNSAAADLNGDGFVDVAVSAGTPSGDLRVYFGDGAGGFSSPLNLAAGAPLVGITLADLNGDLKLDLAAAAFTPRKILLFFGDGLGGFSAPSTIQLGTGQSPFRVRVADFNVDTHADLAVAIGSPTSNPLLVLLGDGVGGFGAPIVTSQYSTGLAVGFLDGDALPDVIAAETPNSGFVALLGNGAGGFASPLYSGSPAAAQLCLLGDFDENGSIDLIATASPANTVTFLPGLGDGTFAPRPIDSVDRATDVRAADFDHDGDLDLVVSGQGAQSPHVLSNDGNGGFTVTATLPTVGSALAIGVGDLDHDGNSDVVITTSMPALLIGLGDGAGNFLSSSAFGTGNDPRYFELGDVDADGNLDAFCTGPSGVGGPSQLRVLRGDGAGGFGVITAHTVSATPTAISVADVNGDGRADAVVTLQGGNVLLFLANAQGTLGTPTTLNVGASPSTVRLVDFDCDGKCDLLVALGTLTPALAVLLGDGSGGFGAPILSPQTNVFSGMRVADIDTDGRLDVVYNDSRKMLGVARGDGAGHVLTPEFYAAGSTGVGLCLVDFNGDHRCDVAAAESTPTAPLGGLYVLANVGDGRPVVAYCTAKTNSLGCVPAIDSTGLPSASSTAGFVVVGNQVRNNKPGLLFYGVTGRNSAPFQGGTLCVKAPVKRTPGVNSAGSPAPSNDCSGIYSIDMSAFAAGLLSGTPLPALRTPCTTVQCQWWGRDPGFIAPNNTTLTDALEYVVGM